MPDQKWFTADGVEITPGLRVLTTDLEWGTVVPEQFTDGGSEYYPGGKRFDGWFYVRLDKHPQRDGMGWAYGTTTCNGERMRTTEMPRW